MHDLISYHIQIPPIPSWKVRAQNQAGVCSCYHVQLMSYMKLLSVVCCFALFYDSSEKRNAAFFPMLTQSRLHIAQK